MAQQAPRISADVSGEQLINDINAAFARIWKRLDKIEALAVGASVNAVNKQPRRPIQR